MDRITEFVDSFIPENLPEKRREELKEELTNHILDKSEYYNEIGYNESESITKAIKDFGTDEIIKKYIFGEFEELYSEKTVFGILAGLLVWIMNILCFPLDIWVVAADYNRDADPAGAFMSFCMIFVILFLIVFARVKKYRKMLFCLGIANLTVVISLLANLYSQMASYAIGYNMIYIIDRFTPLSMGDIIVMSYEGLIIELLWMGIPIVTALYSLICSFRLKRGTAKNINHPKKKIAVFSGISLCFIIFSCLLLPISMEYIDDYPIWFDKYYNYISEESEEKFSEIYIGRSFEEVRADLYSEGYTTIEPYRNSLDRLSKKQFDNDVKHFDFIDGYEIWFHPDKYIEGNGFLAIRTENGIVTGMAIGNVNKAMYYKKWGFGYSAHGTNADMGAMYEYFGTLKKGDSEQDIMSRFGSEYGLIYAKRHSVENGVTKSYYRVHCYGITESGEISFFDKKEGRYIELYFENGELKKGTMYTKIYGEKTTVSAEHVK